MLAEALLRRKGRLNNHYAVRWLVSHKLRLPRRLYRIYKQFGVTNSGKDSTDGAKVRDESVKPFVRPSTETDGFPAAVRQSMTWPPGDYATGGFQNDIANTLVRCAGSDCIVTVSERR
jgi:hypothetical protein